MRRQQEMRKKREKKVGKVVIRKLKALRKRENIFKLMQREKKREKQVAPFLSISHFVVFKRLCNKKKPKLEFNDRIIKTL